MGLLVLLLYVLGVGLLAYGLSLVYPPLLWIVIGVFVLASAFATGRAVPRPPQ